jgi:hypothetical protein
MKTEIKMPDTINRLENGGWIDRWTAGSPLIWQGLSYQVDIYGVLYVGDVATGGMVYRQPLKIQGLMHYNAVPVAASPTLVGEHVLVMDNQGNTLVIRPGRGFRKRLPMRRPSSMATACISVASVTCIASARIRLAT